MKKIFIYYSLTGNGDAVAEYLNKKGYDTRKVITKEPLPNNYILRILSGGFKATISHKDKLIDFNNDIKKYDKIVIGSPIWNSRISSPINTVLNNLDLKNKKLDFIFYSGSNKNNKITKYINKKYPDSKIIKLQEPKKNKEELKRINL